MTKPILSEEEFNKKHCIVDTNKTILGYCKECLANIYEEDNCAPDYPNIYECAHCNHPHNKNEILL